MAYKVIVSPRTQKEIENAIDYYALYSKDAAAHFLDAVREAYRTLEINPFFKIRYKNIRSLPLNRFPYSLYFLVNETQHTVRVLSCFHNKRSPTKRPK